MELTIDFSNVNDWDWDTFHALMVNSFRLPSFCGNNGNAYIDCLSDLRYPEYMMTEISLGKDEVLELTLIHTNGKKNSVKYLLEIIEYVNYKSLMRNEIASIVVREIIA